MMNKVRMNSDHFCLTKTKRVKRNSSALFKLPKMGRFTLKVFVQQQMQKRWLQAGIHTRKAQFPEFLERGFESWNHWLQMSTVSFHRTINSGGFAASRSFIWPDDNEEWGWVSSACIPREEMQSRMEENTGLRSASFKPGLMSTWFPLELLILPGRKVKQSHGVPLENSLLPCVQTESLLYISESRG